MALRAAGRQLREIHKRLLTAHGPQHWWPANSAFEVMVGAVLTQNTAWTNVERAIAALRSDALLGPEAILAADEVRLAAALRPSGYFNVKARRLRALCAWLVELGGVDGAAGLCVTQLRASLLGVHGIGPETADDIVLYAFGHPVFVIDAYTRRLYARLGQIDGDEPYEQLRGWFEQSFGPDTGLFNEHHALIVRHAKDVCRKRVPHCGHCVLSGRCAAYRTDPSRAVVRFPVR